MAATPLASCLVGIIADSNHRHADQVTPHLTSSLSGIDVVKIATSVGTQQCKHAKITSEDEVHCSILLLQGE